MFRNYFLVALRNIRKNKSLTIINVLGLSLGMAISLLSILYILNELSFDNFHDQKQLIYRLIARQSLPDKSETSAVMTAGVGPSFKEQVPEIEIMVRISNPRDATLTIEDHNYQVQNVMYADSAFFKLFSFDLMIGNVKNMLDRPYQVVLTKSTAEKVFGRIDNAMNKVVRMNDRDDLLVTGIVNDPPANSHLQFGAVVSFSSLYKDPQMYLGWNGGWNYFTYVLLKVGADLQKIEHQFTAIADENINEQLRDLGVRYDYFLQPLDEVHLNSNIDTDIDTRGSLLKIWLISAITFVILIIACINFINLTTAASLARMKEIGVRKVAGATRTNIVSQFITETLLISLISLAGAFLFIEIFSAVFAWLNFDENFQQNLVLGTKSIYQVVTAIVILVITVGLAAGAYPAFFMARLNPAISVKGKIRITHRNPVVRNLLVVFQFTIATTLIISAIVVASQLNYLIRADKGFNPENKLIVSLKTEQSRGNSEILKQELLKIPGIVSAGASSEIPGHGYTSNGYIPEGKKEPVMFHALDIDYDYLKTMDFSIIQGRSFSKSYGLDEDAYMINQILAKQLGWDDPVGKVIQRNGPHKIIGVVKDFHFSPLNTHIEPLIITVKPWRGYGFLTLKLAHNNPSGTRNMIEQKWKSLFPQEDLTFFNLTSSVDEAYDPVRGFMLILLFCSLMAVIIAALGLFALAAFSTRQRFREIAVRKVFGADNLNITYLVTAGFLKWVILANILAWPIAYLLMERYLQNFAFSAGINGWIFVLVFTGTAIFSFMVIFYQVIRLSNLNPVKYIRYE